MKHLFVIAFLKSPQTVQTSCGSISVTRTSQLSGAFIVYDIQMNCPTLAPFPQIKVDNTGMTGSVAWKRQQMASNPIRGTYQVEYSATYHY